jgi:hypothetical protein
VLEVLVVVAVQVLEIVDDSVDVVRPSQVSSQFSYDCITLSFVEVLKSESRNSMDPPRYSNTQPARPASDSDTSTYFGP